MGHTKMCLRMAAVILTFGHVQAVVQQKDPCMNGYALYEDKWWKVVAINDPQPNTVSLLTHGEQRTVYYKSDFITFYDAKPDPEANVVYNKPVERHVDPNYGPYDPLPNNASALWGVPPVGGPSEEAAWKQIEMEVNALLEEDDPSVPSATVPNASPHKLNDHRAGASRATQRSSARPHPPSNANGNRRKGGAYQAPQQRWANQQSMKLTPEERKKWDREDDQRYSTSQKWWERRAPHKANNYKGRSSVKSGHGTPNSRRSANPPPGFEQPVQKAAKPSRARRQPQAPQNPRHRSGPASRNAKSVRSDPTSRTRRTAGGSKGTCKGPPGFC